MLDLSALYLPGSLYDPRQQQRQAQWEQSDNYASYGSSPMDRGLGINIAARPGTSEWNGALDWLRRNGWGAWLGDSGPQQQTFQPNETQDPGWDWNEGSGGWWG